MGERVDGMGVMVWESRVNGPPLGAEADKGGDHKGRGGSGTGGPSSHAVAAVSCAGCSGGTPSIPTTPLGAGSVTAFRSWPPSSPSPVFRMEVCGMGFDWAGGVVTGIKWASGVDVARSPSCSSSFSSLFRAVLRTAVETGKNGPDTFTVRRSLSAASVRGTTTTPSAASSCGARRSDDGCNMGFAADVSKIEDAEDKNADGGGEGGNTSGACAST